MTRGPQQGGPDYPRTTVELIDSLAAQCHAIEAQQQELIEALKECLKMGDDAQRGSAFSKAQSLLDRIDRNERGRA